MNYGVYRTKKQATKALEKQKALVRVWKYVQDNGMYFEPNFSNGSKIKYQILFDGEYNNFLASSTFWMKYQDSIPCFKSKEHAQNVIDNCEDDLKIIFDIK